MREQGVFLVAGAVVRKALAEAYEKQRDDVFDQLHEGDRFSVRVGDKKIGTVTRTEPAPGKTEARVKDPQAFLAWVEKHHPEELEVSVRGAFLTGVLSRCRDGGGEFATTDGEPADCPPGVEFVHVPGARSTLQVRPASNAAAVIREAVADGSLSLASLLELPGGEQ